MKKLFVAALMMVSSVAVFAQHSAGSVSIQPKVGGTLTSIVGDDTSNAEMKFGIVSGVELEYQATDMIGIAAGVNYSMQGASIKTPDLKLKFENLNIPIIANFYVAKNFALKLGVQPGFLLNAKSDKLDVKSAYKTFDLSIPVGASYEIDDFVIDARYNFGVTNILDTDAQSQRNSVIQLTLGYKFDI
ncbi:porin family protein [Prevotella sp. OH937_COT-195]|uniref:porin family protein n=1 Tax=Prevotella sp. OH937_COT-195 TaxID=2491051 RepID=UPI000F654A3F|nr:porin family protein [Prevotella sp. OH937_COT-195]RRD02286.1 porin family protein [Prevotella sp. OH937_COT-195]